MKPIATNLMVLACLFAFTGNPPRLAAAEGGEGTAPDIGTDKEKGARLQIFLDRAEFAPGKIDGQSGQFTQEALRLYRESLGEAGKNDAGKDVPSDLDLASVDPLFITYTVTPADVAILGKVPEEVADQAKLSAMPYETVIEVIAEKFHVDVNFLSELNPGKDGEFKEGDKIQVPNVVPFDIAAVKDLKIDSKSGRASVTGPGDETAAKAETPAETADAKPDEAPAASSAPVAVDIDTKSSMLTVREQGKLVAAYPVTFGSALNESPVGDWKVTGIAKMPDFRYDKAMLERGVRSDEFSIIPPGPNNPVGVLWIALNKEGIGVHGTSNPESIGRSDSHGCIRMANWDVVRLARRLKAGVPVVIE